MRQSLVESQRFRSAFSRQRANLLLALSRMSGNRSFCCASYSRAMDSCLGYTGVLWPSPGCGHGYGPTLVGSVSTMLCWLMAWTHRRCPRGRSGAAIGPGGGEEGRWGQTPGSPTARRAWPLGGWSASRCGPHPPTPPAIKDVEISAMQNSAPQLALRGMIVSFVAGRLPSCSTYENWLVPPLFLIKHSSHTPAAPVNGG